MGGEGQEMAEENLSEMGSGTWMRMRCEKASGWVMVWGH